MARSAVLGVVFGALVGASGRSDTGTLAGTGLAYGVVLAGIVMPIWLSAVGFPMAPPLPNLDPMSLGGHAVYGVVLGVVYAIVR